MTQLFAYVNDAQVLGAADGTSVGIQATKRGELRVEDFWTQMALQGRCYQVREGTIATPIAVSSTITDAQANMSVDALVGTTIIPAQFRLSFDDIATATTFRAFLKAVGVVSSAGTAFVPLPLKQGGPASVSTARVATAGVTVTAELATTTRRLWEYANVGTETPASATAPEALAGALAAIASTVWAPRIPYVGVGPACVYFQAGATTAQNLAFGTIDYVELPSANV